jgi:hypothetical protein
MIVRSRFRAQGLGGNSMQAMRFPVDVVMERVPLVNRWVDEVWRPAAVEPRASFVVEDGYPAVCIQDDAGARRWRISGQTIELHPTEGEGYFLNLTSPEPCVFVMWRLFDDGEPPARPVLVTVSYNQAGRLLDGGERVDNVAMPELILNWMRPFVAAHYKPEPRKKVKRNDPFAEDAPGRSGESRRGSAR